LASGQFDHAVTTGETREAQVLDVLKEVLPTRHLLTRHPVIVSADGTQSPSFDAALVDRSEWPLLYSGSGTVAVMVESVALALEIKSDLDRAEIENIFSKTAGLRTLAVGFPSPGGATVMVSAFAYQCANPHLAYFDFAAASMLDPASSPREICALNVGIFTHSQVVGGNQSLSSQANRNSTPVFLPTEKDSLLLWVYLLCRWLGRGSVPG